MYLIIRNAYDGHAAFTEARISVQGKEANLRPCLAIKLSMAKATLERISLVLVSVQLSIGLPKAMYWSLISKSLTVH